MAYLLIWNSRSESAVVIGAFRDLETAKTVAEARHRAGRRKLDLAWVHWPDDQDEQEHWVAECGVVDQWEIHALELGRTNR